jgi:hypothetical protein
VKVLGLLLTTDLMPFSCLSSLYVTFSSNSVWLHQMALMSFWRSSWSMLIFVNCSISNCNVESILDATSDTSCNEYQQVTVSSCWNLDLFHSLLLELIIYLMAVLSVYGSQSWLYRVYLNSTDNLLGLVGRFKVHTEKLVPVVCVASSPRYRPMNVPLRGTV